jgi:aryl-alcohol dehydrogenase
MTTTRAAVVRETSGPFTIEELELDDPRDTEVRVRMAASGICHTDAIVRDGERPTPLPVVLGHEGAGIVEAVGAAVRGVREGDHVVLSMNTCGRCPKCLAGENTYCDESWARNFGARRPDGSTAFSRSGGELVGSHFFGQSSFSQLTNADERSVVVVDPELPLELLGPLGCGLQTGAGSVINVLRPGPGSSFAVFGAGAVGLAGLLAARLIGCERIIAVDIHASRLALAEELGATDVVDARAGDVAAQIAELTGGAGVSTALDTTGIPDVLRAAVDALAVRGTLGIVGGGPPGATTPIDTSQLNRGWTLRLIIEGDAVPQQFIPMMIRHWQAGRFPFDRLITQYPIAQINEAFADSAAGTTIKPVVIHGG